MKSIYTLLLIIASVCILQSNTFAQKAESRSSFQNQKELPSDKPTYGYVELKLIYELNGKFAHADLDIQGNERDIKMAGDGAFTTKLMAVRKASSKLQALNILGDLGYQVVAMSQEDVLKSKVTSYIMMRLD